MNNPHIKQRRTGEIYVYIANATGDLTQHPAMIEHPELFRIVNDEPPEGAEELIYRTDAEVAASKAESEIQ